MEANRWVLVASFIFFVSFIPLTFYVTDSRELSSTLMGGLKNIIAQTLRSWLSGDREVTPLAAGYHEGPFFLSPNLSTCQPAEGHEGLIVDCCPPAGEASETIFDFQFPDPSIPLRTRRRVHLLDDEYIAKYVNAVTIMRNLPDTDPRSYYRQSNLHCLYCTGAYSQKYSNSTLKIHRSWLFFPWHRMFLYFHERILGSLIGDENFSLPFWNWDCPDGMTVPELYLNFSSMNDTERDRYHFPPELTDLNYNETESELETDDQERIDRNTALMYNQMVSGAKKTELFMGCQYRPGFNGSCNGPGSIEFAPHNTVHKWIGSPLNPAWEDMGVFYSAARDPIFFAHHSNIDRLWEIWREMNNYTLEISDLDWLETYFYFHDENSQLIKIRFRDILNITKLGYEYEQIDVPWMNFRPEPSVPVNISRTILRQKMNIPDNFELPGYRFLDSTITLKINRPNWHNKTEDDEEVILVHGIDLKDDDYVKFDVYVNLIDESMANPKYREFAGTFVNLPSGVKYESEEMEESINLKLGISELLTDLEADEDDFILVTLLPATKNCVNLSIDGVRIEYLS